MRPIKFSSSSFNAIQTRMRGQGSDRMAQPLAGQVSAENAGKPAPAIGTGNEAAARFVLIPYPVSANRYWRKFGNRVVVSKEAEIYRKSVAMTFLAAGMRKIESGPVGIHILLHPKMTVKGVASKTRIDLGNSEKVLSDALNGVAWTDDKQLVRILMELADPVLNGGVSIKVEAI